MLKYKPTLKCSRGWLTSAIFIWSWKDNNELIYVKWLPAQNNQGPKLLQGYIGLIITGLGIHGLHYMWVIGRYENQGPKLLQGFIRLIISGLGIQGINYKEL